MAQSLLVGTTKGLFIVDADSGDVTGPHCSGWGINHVASDPATGTIWAGGGGDFFGGGVFRSTDRGQSWQLTRLSTGQIDQWIEGEPEAKAWFPQIDFDTPPPFAGKCGAVWSLNYAHGALHAGTKGALLLKSTDGGMTFEDVDAVTNYPGREEWQPGGAGLVLHTLVSDPADAGKLWFGVSAAGIYATEDGGESFEKRVRTSNAEAAEDHGDHEGHDHPTGEIGYCVHNFVRSTGGTGDLLYQQNHHGVWKSSDGGRSWDDISAGLPSTFGFPIGVDPDDPQTIWCVPLEEQDRIPLGGSAAVWKSSDGGGTWVRMEAGLPQKNCYFTVLRQAMATAPGGVWFGTNSGSVFGSRDGGESWDEIARHLPTVLCVEAAAFV